VEGQEAPFFEFTIYSKFFLQRARENLRRFDNGDVASLFYAALDLRFGIEARLYEYIDPVFKSNNISSEDIREYVATRLLTEFTRAEPDAERRMILRSLKSGTDEVLAEFEYTPVTKKLAKMHGKLGEMLHYKFFRNNKNWMMKSRLQFGGKSLADFRVFLDEVANELAEATRGTLLGPAHFTGLIKQLIEEKLRDG
jgi:hypothetical protein